MKKIVSMICVVLMVIGCIGCGQKEEKVDKTDKTDKGKVEEKANVQVKDDNEGKKDEAEKKADKANVTSKEPAQVAKPVESKKAIYIEKIKQVEASISDLASYYSGITVEQKYAASEEYLRWDNLLNEIYGVLKKDMPINDFKKLQSEQIKWISDKEQKAKDASKQYEGGTQYEVEYSITLGKVTKERCKYLVNTYMK